MKKSLLLFFAFQLLVMWTISCARHGGPDGLRIVEGYWGHLTDIDTTSPSPMFLGHL